jgi:hypothetical protein
MSKKGVPVTPFLFVRLFQSTQVPNDHQSCILLNPETPRSNSFASRPVHRWGASVYCIRISAGYHLGKAAAI